MLSNSASGSDYKQRKTAHINPKCIFRNMLFRSARVGLLSEVAALTCLMSVCRCCVEVLNAVKCCFTLMSVNESTQVEHGGTSCLSYLSSRYLTNWLCSVRRSCKMVDGLHII